MRRDDVRAAVAFIALVGVARVARADEPPEDPTPVTKPTPPVVAPARDEELLERIEALETRQHALEAELRQSESTREQVQTLMPLLEFLTVFVDVGAFAAGGNGSGIRSDFGHIYYPKYVGQVPGQWVKMGDTLATAINSFGEPADTSDSRELPANMETLKTRGHPSLIVNSLGLAVGKVVNPEVSVAALVELLPRPGANILDIELARIDYRPWHAVDLMISAGKIDSVVGIEYRAQDAPKRLTVTPSLICRYTCGRQPGIQARLRRGPMYAALMLANGDSFDDRFEPLLALHANALPTASGHLQWTLPIGQDLVVGASGAIGPQTNQPLASLVQWHVGLDARLRDLAGFDITAEIVQGRQPGRSSMSTSCDLAPCLTYKGGYLLVDHRTTKWLTPYFRVDWRDAVHHDGVEFVYESHVIRSTIGAHFEMTSRIIAKIEYTFVRELGNTPQFPDDVLTSSVVVATD
jgi:hypothetical protein